MVADHSVFVKSRMTTDEWKQEQARVRRLLDEISEHISTFEVKQLAVYASQRRIGARFEYQHDPLGNGVLVGNIEDFSVEAVQPQGFNEVYVRFQENE